MEVEHLFHRAPPPHGTTGQVIFVPKFVQGIDPAADATLAYHQVGVRTHGHGDLAQQAVVSLPLLLHELRTGSPGPCNFHLEHFKKICFITLQDKNKILIKVENFLPFFTFSCCPIFDARNSAAS